MAGTTHNRDKRTEEEYVYTPPSEGNYVRIRVPQINLALFTTPKALLLLILLSYLLSAFLYMKVRSLEGYGSTGGGVATVVSTNATNVSGAFADYAKTAKMDVKKFTSCLSAHKYANKITTDIAEANTAGITSTPGFIINGTAVVGAETFSTFQAVIEQELARSVLNTFFAFTPKAYAQSPSVSQKITVNNGHLPVLGKKNAKVTIVEFSDFQCPFCKQFFTGTFDQIKKTYIDTGKVNLYYRQLPLTSIHPNAQLAAEASECANEQGKFWQFHDILFTNQESWASLPQTQTPAI